MHVYLIQTPLQSQSACKSHPGGGGVLHLVSEHMVYEKEQKLLKNYFQIKYKVFSKEKSSILKGYSPKSH